MVSATAGLTLTLCVSLTPRSPEAVGRAPEVAVPAPYRLRHVRRPGVALWRVRPAFTMTFAGLFAETRF